MSAQPYEPPRQTAIPRDALSVRAALPPERAVEFKQKWDAALDQAHVDMDLRPLLGLVDEYWGIASAAASPYAAEATEQGRRFLAGQDIGVVPAAEVFAGLR